MSIAKTVPQVSTGKPAMEFVTTPIRRPSSSSVIRIQNKDIRRQFAGMSDLRVLWLVTSHLGYKRRVGLLIFALLAYIGLDHLGGLHTLGEIIYGTLFG